MATAIFSIVPVEVWADKRLTLKQMRVLGVLFSFRNKNTDIVWPSRAQIAERCGMSVCHVSTATTDLERLGWLRKDGKGGHSKSTRYAITVPDLIDAETVPETGTVPNYGTVPKSGTGGVPESGTRLRVPESGTGKEQTIEQTSEQTKVGDEPPVSSKAADPCPHQAIMDLYHEILPTGRHVRSWNDTRKAKLRARWKEEAKRQSLDWWAKFFGYIAESDFLTGKTSTPGRRPFEIDLEWIVTPSNFVKILEGKYENEPAAATPSVPAQREAMFRGCI
ncbi:MAG: helix-turn-helix domain-containing protein [Zoogloea sp.]|uniref:helix-turn-helix domain-containing protein n=1 Tax=Zoogloea sp. TaxID=49181 RepID=UPI00262BA40B|nr:helix-turn-helix domain-containing protein [Zoogloea sp.]MDD2989107.1 helix-turn-helix domain-containing protein [Zoogloea sp.]